MQNNMQNKIAEWRETFSAFDDSMDLYQFLIDLGKDMQKDPLEEQYRLEENRVSRCQYSLFVARPDNEYKAYSDGIIASGYSAVLLDIFNNSSTEEIATVDPMSVGKGLGIREILSGQRQNGFYQMMEVMKRHANHA